MITPEEALSKVNKLYAELSKRRRDVDHFEAYFRCEQPLAFASQEWKNFNADRFKGFSDNWCGVVASSPAERIKLTGVRLGTDSDILSDDEVQLMSDWQRNEMDAQSSQGILHTIITGRSAVIVWPDEYGDPRMDWERADQVIVAYEPGGRRRVAALKAWVDGELEYATLYLPDELWKFQRPVEKRGFVNLILPAGVGREEVAWTPREVDGELWPVQNPLGEVPVVEVPNRPMLGAEPISDIAGTISMQNAINLLWAYLFAAADYASMPARVVMGQEPPKIPVLDENGVKVGEKPVDIDALTRGRMLWLTGQDTTVGQWDPARLDGFLDVINRSVRHVAAQTRTPVHYIVGELANVNGETLLAGETGLVKKVEEWHLFGSGSLRDVFRLSALIRGRQAVAEALRSARILWADPQTRTQAQASDAAIKDRQVGFPLAWVAEQRYGLTPPEVQRMLELRDAESASLLTGDLAAAFGPKPQPSA